MDSIVQWARDLWKAPNIIDMAYRELIESERSLLSAQSGVEYAQAMVEYETKRVARLKEYLRKAGWDRM